MTEQQHNDTLANAINTGINSQSNINRTFRGEIGDNYFLADLRDDMDFYRFEGGGGDRIAWKVTADGMPWYLAIPSPIEMLKDWRLSRVGLFHSQEKRRNT